MCATHLNTCVFLIKAAVTVRATFVWLQRNKLGSRKFCGSWSSHLTKFYLWQTIFFVCCIMLHPNTNGHEKLCFLPLCNKAKHTRTHTNTEKHTALPPVWVGGVATQQLSGAAYGVSNWVEQHSWRTPVQDLASGNQSHNPQLSSAHPCVCVCAFRRWGMLELLCCTWDCSGRHHTDQ